MSTEEHNGEEKVTVQGWITILALIGFFCTIVWSQVKAGVPWWWAPIVACVFTGCALAISRLDTKTLAIFFLLCVSTLVVTHVMG